MSNEKIREDWLDANKGFAILIVVLGHVFLGYAESNTFAEINDVIVKINEWIYTWHMPLFCLLSGYAFSISCLSKKIVNRNKVKKHILNFGLIYLFFSVSLGVLKLIFSNFVNNKIGGIQNLILTIILPNNIMWYLWVLILYYWVFEKIDLININPKIIFAFFAGVSFLGGILNEVFVLRLCLRNFLYNFVFFYWGIILEKNRFLKRVKYQYNISVIIAIIYISIKITDLDIISESIFMPFLNYINAIAIVYFVVFIFNNTKLGENKWLIETGKASLVIYLLHTYCVTALRVILPRFFYINSILTIILTWILASIITFFIYYATKGNKLFGYIFKPIQILELFK